MIGVVLSLIGASAGFAITSPQLMPRDIAGRMVKDISAKTTSALVALGFGISQVSISGHRYTSDNDVFDALDLPNVATMWDLDLAAAMKRIERMPWVQSAQISRVFPGGLDISIAERTPAALWSHGGAAYLVDVTGRVLGSAPKTHEWQLPIVTGEGANTDIAVLLSAFGRNRDLENRVLKSERVAERRWRIVLKNGSVIELGAEREVEGLDRVASNLALRSTIAGDAKIIDVRTPGRVAVRPLVASSSRGP